jgi:hypothetical protein
MEQFTLQQKLYIIVLELTTPLVSLNGFCDVVKDRTKSQFVLEQLETIKGAVEHVKSEKDILREKISTKNDRDFISEITAADYLRKFALELQDFENAITSSVNQLYVIKYTPDDPHFEEWAKSLSINASENLSKKLASLRTIQPDLELTTQDR